MTTRRGILRPALLALLLLAGASAVVGAAQNVPPKAAASKPAVEAPAKEVHPAFLTPREKSGAYVFLGWTWLSIGVLLYFLRLKVREADRVFLTGLYGTAKGGKEPPGHP